MFEHLPTFEAENGRWEQGRSALRHAGEDAHVGAKMRNTNCIEFGAYKAQGYREKSGENDDIPP